MAYNTIGTIGPNFTQLDTSAQFAVGSRIAGSGGSEYVYVSCAGSIAQYAIVTVTSAHAAAEATIATGGADGTSLSKVVAIAPIAMTAATYGWVATRPGGGLSVLAAASAVAGRALFLTATAGVVDDAVVAGSQVDGLTLLTTVAGAQAATTCMGGNLNISL